MLDLETLLDRCRRGDDLAWEALVRRYTGRVYAVAFHYMRNVEEARDEFSFSRWGLLDQHKRTELRAEIWHEVEEGEMPLSIYRVMHSEARLSQDQLDVIREWAMADGAGDISTSEH